MKKIYFIALLPLAGVLVLRAQTNSPNTNAVAEILALVTTNAPTPPPPAPRAPTKIDADSADFDLKGHLAVYEGHVRVDSPQRKLACEQLTINLPTEGGRINHVVAETNVVIDALDEKGATNHVTCGKAVYNYSVQGAVTNESVTLTGSPHLENAQGTNDCDEIIWFGADHYRIINPHMSSNPNFGGASANTNSSLPKLF